VLKDYNSYNQSVITAKSKSQEQIKNEKIKLIEERLKELRNLNNLELAEKLNQEKTQLIYKEILEEQMKIKGSPRPRMNGNNLNTINMEEMEHNNLVRSCNSIKPCKIKNFYTPYRFNE
jgi:hypothetical protein